METVIANWVNGFENRPMLEPCQSFKADFFRACKLIRLKTLNTNFALVKLFKTLNDRQKIKALLTRIDNKYGKNATECGA